MNKKHHRHNKRRHIIREQLTGYGPAADQEIPYSDQYTQFMVTERNCKPATAKHNLKMVKEFSRFLKLEYGLDTFDPLSIEPSHVRRYLIHLKKDRENSTGTRNNKLSALKSYYFFSGMLRIYRRRSKSNAFNTKIKGSPQIAYCFKLRGDRSVVEGLRLWKAGQTQLGYPEIDVAGSTSG